MALDLPRRKDGMVGGRFGKAQALEQAVQPVGFFQAIGQAEGGGQFARQPAATRDSLDQGGAAGQRPRRLGIFTASKQVLAMLECPAGAAEARHDEQGPDQGRDQRSRAGRDQQGFHPEQLIRAGGGTIWSTLGQIAVGDASQGLVCHVAPEVVGERRGVGIAGCGVSCQAFPDQFGQPGRDARDESPGLRRSSFAWGQRLCGEHLCEHATQRIEVGSRIDPRGVRPARGDRAQGGGLLGRHVAGRTPRTVGGPLAD